MKNKKRGAIKKSPLPDKTKKYIVPYKGIVRLNPDRWQVSP